MNARDHHRVIIRCAEACQDIRIAHNDLSESSLADDGPVLERRL